MPSLRSQLLVRFAAFYTSRWRRDLLRRWAELRRRLSGRPHEVDVFIQADDPYSHLLLQALPAFTQRFDVALRLHLVDPPPDALTPERALLEAFARKDAGDIAPDLGLGFPAAAQDPGWRLSSEALSQARRALAACFTGPQDLRRAAAITEALWSGAPVEGELAPAEHSEALARAGSALREAGGHYLSGMLLYSGEWYWAVDRLDHLERRLEGLGLRREGAPAGPSAPRPQASAAEQGVEDPGAVDASANDAAAIEVELFLSVRSPYSYLALARALTLPGRLPVTLTLRPVLPMVMRGLAVPLVKRLYLVRDAKREADTLGIPFGRIADPLGRPIERLYSLWPMAKGAGRGGALLTAATRRAWAEGVSIGDDATLRAIVEEAGLDWAEAQRALDGEAWREEVEANRQALLGMGVWGVPSFRVRGGGPDFVTWGQDRLWLVEAEVRRRLQA